MTDIAREVAALGDTAGRTCTLRVRFDHLMTISVDMHRDEAEQLAIELQRWLIDTSILEFRST